MAWEYLVVSVSESQLENMLNHYGGMGWEAFSIRDAATDQVTVTFKRPESGTGLA